MKYQVIVKPGAKQAPRIEATPDGLIVYLREKPIDGAANTALVKALAAHFRVPKTSIAIVGGAKSRRKLVEIPSPD